MQALLLVLALPALAFHPSVHDAITTDELKANGYDDESIKLINQGNRDADQWDPKVRDGEGQVPEAHFDDESFETGSQRIAEKLTEASCALLRCDRPRALERIGRALHPTQDFFSHTNFIELELALGRKLKVDFLHLKKNKASTCDPVSHLPLDHTAGGLEDLTGEWFSAGDPDWKPKGKCSHKELAKDWPDPNPKESARPDVAKFLFPTAKARATEEGVKFVRDVVEPMVRKSVHAAHAQGLLKAADDEDDESADQMASRFLEYLKAGGDCPANACRSCPALRD